MPLNLSPYKQHVLSIEMNFNSIEIVVSTSRPQADKDFLKKATNGEMPHAAVCTL